MSYFFKNKLNTFDVYEPIALYKIEGSFYYNFKIRYPAIQNIANIRTSFILKKEGRDTVFFNISFRDDSDDYFHKNYNNVLKKLNNPILFDYFFLNHNDVNVDYEIKREGHALTLNLSLTGDFCFNLHEEYCLMSLIFLEPKLKKLKDEKTKNFIIKQCDNIIKDATVDTKETKCKLAKEISNTSNVFDLNSNDFLDALILRLDN